MEILTHLSDWIKGLEFLEGLVILILAVGAYYLKEKIKADTEIKSQQIEANKQTSKEFKDYVVKRDVQFAIYEERYHKERQARRELAEIARKEDNQSREKLSEALNEMATAIKINTERLNK